MTSRPLRTSTPPRRGERREQRRGQRPRVDRRLAGRVDAAVEGRGEARLELAAAARRQPLGLEAERALQVVDAAQLGGLVAVEGDVERAAALVPGARRRRRLELGDEPGRARPRRASSPAARGSPKVSSPTGASIPAATPVAPAGGSARSSTTTRAPRWAARQAQARPMTPPPTNTASNYASRSSIASAGITRIRFRRSAASMPPSQPLGLPYSTDATTRRRIRERHNRVDEPRRPRGKMDRCAASGCAPPASTSSAVRGPAESDLEACCGRRSAAASTSSRCARRSWGGREIERAAGTFRRVCDTYSALFIVNDEPDLARACDADGVHVGQDDSPVAEARGAARPGRDHRPLDPFAGADRRGRRGGPSTTSASGRSGRRRPRRVGRQSGWS